MNIKIVLESEEWGDRLTTNSTGNCYLYGAVEGETNEPENY